jgi:hypothetical protein
VQVAGSLARLSKFHGEVTSKESQIVLSLRQVQQDVLTNGRIEGHHLAVLRQELYAGGKIDRRGADILVELHKRVQHHQPEFERFFYSAVKDYALQGGRIDAEKTNWLSAMLTPGDWIKDEDRKLLHELKGEAKQLCPEFESFFAENMKRPQERHSC